MGWWCVTYSVQVDVYPAVRGLLAPQRAPDNSLANSLFAHAEDIGGLLERHPTGWLHRHPLGCLPIIGGILPLRAPFVPVRRQRRGCEQAYYGRGPGSWPSYSLERADLGGWERAACVYTSRTCPTTSGNTDAGSSLPLLRPFVHLAHQAIRPLVLGHSHDRAHG